MDLLFVGNACGERWRDISIHNIGPVSLTTSSSYCEIVSFPLSFLEQICYTLCSTTTHYVSHASSGENIHYFKGGLYAIFTTSAPLTPQYPFAYRLACHYFRRLREQRDHSLRYWHKFKHSYLTSGTGQLGTVPL